MKKLNVAILGQGRSGYAIHGKHLQTDTDRFQVVAVVDRLPERRAKAERIFNCQTFEDYTELFGRADIDLVINALPSWYHAPVSIDLLRHGFHVLTEKPVGHAPEDVDAEVAAAKENGKMIAFFQQSRFAPYFRKVREIVDSGILGRLIQISISFDGFLDAGIGRPFRSVMQAACITQGLIRSIRR